MFYTHYGWQYTIAAASIIGPIPLIFSFAIIAIFIIKSEKEIHLLKDKNLVTLALIGIFVSCYIFILDIFAVNVVCTHKHEYEEELSGKHIVTYITFAFDLVVCIIHLILLLCLPVFRRLGKEEKTLHAVMYLLLIPPCLCFTTHFGYIVLAWITDPAKSTTTLILYYFICLLSFGSPTNLDINLMIIMEDPKIVCLMMEALNDHVATVIQAIKVGVVKSSL